MTPASSPSVRRRCSPTAAGSSMPAGRRPAACASCSIPRPRVRRSWSCTRSSRPGSVRVPPDTGRMALEPARWSCTPYSTAATERLSAELEVSHDLATILVRRGFDTPEVARRHLAADERHDPLAFGGMDIACELVLGHLRRESRIVVHGDYDVDGVCSTAILVRVLRTLGADVGWYLPSRTEDGYGLSLATVDRLAAAGTRLLITADCGITAVAEVAAARSAGMGVVG